MKQDKKNLKYCAIYSGGKDGHLALLKMLRGGYNISSIMTFDGGTVHSKFFHDLRKTEILKVHAERIGIPLVIVPLEKWMKNGVIGEKDMIIYAADLISKKYPFDAFCSGNTDGDEDGSADNFRESGIKAGVPIITPLAGMSVLEILRQQEKAGIKAIIVAAERGKLPESVLGMETGNKFAAMIEKLNQHGIKTDGNDFHTLVIDSPLFSSPFEIKSKEIIRDNERSYLKITEFK